MARSPDPSRSGFGPCKTTGCFGTGFDRGKTSLSPWNPMTSGSPLDTTNTQGPRWIGPKRSRHGRERQ